MSALAITLARAPGRCHEGFDIATQHPGLCGCSATPDEWAIFTAAVRSVVRADGTIHQADVRPLIRGRIESKHIGQLWKRARREGLVAEAGHERSDDEVGKNAGRMEPYYALASAA